MNAIDTAKAWAQLYFLKTGKAYVGATTELRNEKGQFFGPMPEIADEVGVDPHTVWEYLQLFVEPNYVIESMARK